MDKNLVLCADHSYAPGSIVCNHVFAGKAMEVYALRQDDGETFDWLCAHCFNDIGPDNMGVDDLRLACMHCARLLVAKATIHYPDEK